MQASLLKLLWETKNNEANWTQQTNKHKRCKKNPKTKQNKQNQNQQQQKAKGISQLCFNELLFLL